MRSTIPPSRARVFKHVLVITKWQKYNQNTTILYFISYERVNHIAVYNYMFRPLSAIVRLYYFLLYSKTVQNARRLLLVTRSLSYELHIITQLL